MLLGRGKDIEHIEESLLRGERLVTLTGPAGVGKTALARQVAESMRARAELDVHEVDLSSARDAVSACAEVARVADISLAGVSSERETAELLGRSLATLGPVLIVLDGVNAIVPQARETLRSWLTHAPQAQFLLTARERTRLPEEHARELTPLPVPDASASAWESPAVQLWVERTRAVCPGYEPNDAELPAIAHLVRELDGLPLAIELAAARSNTLSPADQVKRLDDRFALLSAPGSGDGTLRPLDVALLDCWEQLSAWEQAALVQCTSFVASFSLADAARVVDLSDHPDAPDTETAVQSLRDKSLALTELYGTQRRLRLYSSVRELARQHAHESHGLEQACLRHAALCLERAARLDGQSLENHELAALGKDLEAVAERFQTRDPVIAIRAALALERWAWSHGPLQRHEQRLTSVLESTTHELPAHESALAYEARARVRRQLGDPEGALSDLTHATEAARALSSDALSARLLLGRALCVSVQEGFLEQAVEEGERALALARAAGDAQLELEILRFLIVTDRRKGDAQHAVTRAEQALVDAQQRGDRFHEAHFLHCLAESHVQLGDMPLASEYASGALTLAERLGTQRLTTQLLVTSANIEHLSQRYDSALARYDQAIAAARALGDRELVALATTFAAFARYEAGRGPAARVQLRDGLALLERVGNRRYAAFARATVAYAEARAGNFDAAERILGEAETALSQQQDAMLLMAVDLCRGLVEVVRSWREPHREGSLRVSAQRRLERAHADKPVPASARSSEVRYIARVLEDLLATKTNAGQRNDVLAVKIARNMHWFELDGGRRVDLRRRRPMQLVLGELVRAPRGEELSPEALIHAGWPGERMLHEAAQNRLHVTLSRLRDLGLRDVLVSTASGYALSPKLSIEWVD